VKMCYKKIFLSLILLITMMAIPVDAKSIVDGYSLQRLTESEQASLAERICLEKKDISEADPTVFVNFDVSPTGMIVMALENSSILVLSQDGTIAHFYTFYDTGSYYVCWKEENICLMLVRGYKILEFSLDGTIQGGYEISDPQTSEEISARQNTFETLKEAKRLVNGAVYYTDNPYSLFGSHRKLFQKGSTEEAYVLYEARSTSVGQGVVMTILVAVLIPIILIVIIVSILNAAKRAAK